MKIAFYIFLFALIIIQFIHVDKTNPKVKSDLKAPANIKKILKESCYDCHSYETEWPWYSSIAPLSWIISNHVKEGREELNFSEWPVSRVKSTKLKKEIYKEIEEGEMPLQGYLYLHPAAEITFNELKAIKQWAEKP